jgi:hypothetical protein
MAVILPSGCERSYGRSVQAIPESDRIVSAAAAAQPLKIGYRELTAANAYFYLSHSRVQVVIFNKIYRNPLSVTAAA